MAGEAPLVLVAGHLTIDDTLLPDGRLHPGALGGNALYAALGARLHGVRVGLVARVGRGYPLPVLAGFDPCWLQPVDLPPIRQWVLYGRDGSREYLPLISSPTYAEMAPAPSAAPGGATHLHVAPLPLPAQAALVRWGKANGLTVTLDPHHQWLQAAALWRELLPQVDVFLPSEAEAGVAGAAALRVVKLGARGVRMGETLVPPAPHGPVADVTGCGDAFCGGFLAGLALGLDPIAAARRGAASAARALEGYGTDGLLYRR